MRIASPGREGKSSGVPAPLVSVVMLAWNSGEYLAEAVASVLDQSEANLELVLVDNGSTDGAVERVRAQRPDPRLRCFRQESNLGIAAGTNLAVQHCRAPWIALHDADDRSHPLRLELQLRAAAADPTLDVLATGVRWMDAAGREEGPYPVWYEPEEIAAYVRFNMPVHHPTVLARREVFAAVPYRAEADLCADYDWFSRVAERYRTGGVSLPLYHYRRHAGSASLARYASSQAHICAIRLAQSRRAAGRPEGFAELCAEAKACAADPEPLPAVYRHFSRRAEADGFFTLAALHAALGYRTRRTWGALLRNQRCLVRAIAADPGAWREALGGLGKGPFWIMLKRAGFPPFPRY